MRRSIVGITTATAAAVGLALAGCAGSGSGGGLEAGAEGGSRPVITFAAAMFAESGRGPKLEALVDEFNKSQDKVTVEPASIPFSSFGSTIFTQMGGGAGPDVIRFDHTDFYAAADAELLLPLDDQIDEAQYKFLSPDKYTKFDGKRYGIAFEISNYSLLYNPKLLTGKPPTTVDEFLATAKKLTGNGVFGFAYRTTMPEQAGMWFDVSNFVYGNGGKWSTPDGKPTVNSPEVVKAVELYKQVYDSGVTPKGADAATYRRMFAEGKIAMMIDNGGVPPIILGQNAKAPIAAAPIPFPSGSQGQVLTPLVVNANTKQPELAVSFIKWLLEPENQAAVQEVLGASSTATAVPRSNTQLKELPFVKVYDAETDSGVPFVVEGQEVKTPEIRQIVVDAVVRVLQGKADAKSAMDNAQRAVESLA